MESFMQNEFLEELEGCVIQAAMNPVALSACFLAVDPQHQAFILIAGREAGVRLQQFVNGEVGYTKESMEAVKRDRDAWKGFCLCVLAMFAILVVVLVIKHLDSN